MFHILRKVKEKYARETERHDKDGFEKADPTPMELPIGMRRPLTIQEQIKQALRSEMVMRGQLERGEETLEDSMDFGGDEEEDLPLTPHETVHMKEEVIREGAIEHRRQERRKKAAEKAPVAPKAPEATPPANPPAKEGPSA